MTMTEQELEDMAAQIVELEDERDFWRNEYEELLECIGGEDPRRSETERCDS